MGKLCSDEEILLISDVIQQETVEIASKWTADRGGPNEALYRAEMANLRLIAEELKKGLMFRIAMDVVAGRRYKSE